MLFSDAVTDDILFDSSQLLAALAEERQANYKALLAERQARQADTFSNLSTFIFP